MDSKKIYSAVLVLIGIILLTILATSGLRPKYMKVNSEELKHIITSEPNFIVIDLRCEEEYNKEHIAGSINLTKDRLIKEYKSLLPDSYETIVVCSSKKEDTEDIAKMLLRCGYRNVYDFGSIDNWKYNLDSID